MAIQNDLQQPEPKANGVAAVSASISNSSISKEHFSSDTKDPPRSFPGPKVHDQATTVTLFNRAQLISSGLLGTLHTFINRAFNSQFGRRIGILSALPRLRYEGQLLDELGEHPETFFFVVRVVETGVICGTAYASRYEGVEAWPEGGERTWQRLGVPEAGVNAWELHLLAVDPAFQWQGLANYLMRIVDEEVLRRSGDSGGACERSVVLISTVKETNEAFYLKRGYKEDYHVKWPDGHMSSRAFTVVHMSRDIVAKETATK